MTLNDLLIVVMIAIPIVVAVHLIREALKGGYYETDDSEDTDESFEAKA